ncbi:hypothetical protein [Bradyrhizobium sp. 131]|uniref:hypothetical protein n=1 Tax=Bradyrhizobium sp. 131 TaxID=2782609 RepID=UPI00200017A6|nr:hypothetical protein [Bradyrhizobium sp. 131]UPK23440.1 hypothetical protein IVA73_38220 [Bradyrhizobium sp. 131]
MEWGYILIFAMGALAGYGYRPKAKPASQDASVSSRASAIDRSNLIHAYARELSNYLIEINPDRYYTIYNRALAEQEKLFAADAKVREAQLLILTERYPVYENFDFIGTRPYVLYRETLERYSEDDLDEHFFNLLKFHSLQRAASEEWRMQMPMLSKKEEDHLYGYVQKVKDSKFKERLKQAVREFNAARRSALSDFQLSDGSQLYESAEIAVFKLYDVAEVVKGFWFKDTNEYGVHSVFYGDDKSYESFYRSDRTFEKREVLPTL